ncbi:uridine kinase family-domain-containing protein [Entophlyctis helioformis]|nr:uridine kinase family-domain-containing protein [Entophlyctis helioformis]
MRPSSTPATASAASPPSSPIADQLSAGLRRASLILRNLSSSSLSSQTSNVDEEQPNHPPLRAAAAPSSPIRHARPSSSSQSLSSAMTTLLRFPFRPTNAGVEAASAQTSMLDIPELPDVPARRRGQHGPFIIGVAGGSAAGKAQVCQKIMDSLEKAGALAAHTKVSYIRLEDFYKPLSAEDVELANRGDYNFDHPDAVDIKLLESCLQTISECKPVDLPRYDFQNKQRLAEAQHIDHPDVVIVRKLRDLITMKVFVDVDADVRLARQVIRDTEERYRLSLDQVLQRYVKFVKPSYEEFIQPTKKFADVIIPRGETNTVAVELLTQHIIDILKEYAMSETETVGGLGITVQDKIRSMAEGSSIQRDAGETSEFTAVPN